MKDYKVAIHAEGHVWVTARSADEAIGRVTLYDISEAFGLAYTYEVVGDADA